MLVLLLVEGVALSLATLSVRLKEKEKALGKALQTGELSVEGTGGKQGLLLELVSVEQLVMV